MKKHLANDACIPFIRTREEFQNKTPSLRGEKRTPGRDSSWGALPQQFHAVVIEASFIVYSYDTPIAWYGPAPALTLADIERFLDGPGLVELEQMLTSEEESTRAPAFPAGQECWQMPAVRYSVTTSEHQHLVQCALAYERTWRESEDRTPVPAAHYATTAHATTPYNKFEKVPCGTGRYGW